MRSKVKIKTWPQFAKLVRKKGTPLLKALGQFPDSVLVAGCQRSGTTLLARIITKSEGMVNYWSGGDDELDAALILSATDCHIAKGRYCFQTTYLNECYPEYFDHIGGYKLIWVLRNPYSVVYSMKYHWRTWALNELFQACGDQFLEGRPLRTYKRFGVLGVPKILRACLSYKGKTSQLVEIFDKIGNDHMLVINYDDLILNKEEILRMIYAFIRLPFKKSYADLIHSRSIHKANKLSPKERELVLTHAFPTYEKLKEMAKS
jgi:hypothetical protein